MSRSISEITQIWDRALIKLQERLPDRHVYSAFFPDTYIHSINNDIITVIANSSLAKSMLNTNYRDVIEQVVGEITQSNYTINFIEKSEIPRVSEIISEQKSTFFKNAKVNPNLTFDNFVVGQTSIYKHTKPLLLSLIHPENYIIRSFFLVLRDSVKPIYYMRLATMLNKIVQI